MRVLLATDFSTNAEKARDLVAGLALPPDSTVQVVHAIEPMPYMNAFAPMPMLELSDYAERELRRELETFVRPLLAADWTVERLLPFGRAADVIVRLFRIEPKDEVASTYSHDEVAGLVEESRRMGLLDEDEYGLVSGALEFYEGTVDEVLLPSDGLVTIPPNATPVDVVAGTDVRGAIRAHDPALEASAAAGAALVTDARGIEDYRIVEEPQA